MNKNDIQNILVFLNRVDLKGNEAVELVRLQQLLVTIGNTPVESDVQAVQPEPLIENKAE